MDLKQFDGKSDDGAEMVVAHPGTGEETDMVITLAGADSKAWQEAVSKVSRGAMRGAKNADRALNRAFTRIVDNKADLLAAATLRWRNIELDGKSLPCTYENAKMLYAKFSWLADQVNEFVGERANFFRSGDADAPGGDAAAD